MADGTDASVDFVVAAYREDGLWQAAPLPLRAAEELDTLVASLRQLPSEDVTLGFASYGDDFFLVLRLSAGHLRVLLSDASAAVEWSVAAQALAQGSGAAALDLDGEGLVPDDDEPDAEPAGDLHLLADLGMDSLELAALCADPELYPDEALAEIAERLGFAGQFASAVEAAAAR